jgi:hypothetical protein
MTPQQTERYTLAKCSAYAVGALIGLFYFTKTIENASTSSLLWWGVLAFWTLAMVVTGVASFHQFTRRSERS